MAEEFPRFSRGVESVCAGLARDFPDAEFEIVAARYLGGAIQRCGAEELQGILKGLGSKFSKVAVAYHPENSYGFVAELRNPSAEGSEEKGKAGKPRIYILVVNVGGTPFAVGSTPAPRQAFDFDEEF